ncbi:unnamed protein product, partial [Timema podura]|nr:unnamed protein product [Timema podura]
VKEGFGNQINICRDRGLNPGLPTQKSDTLPLDRQNMGEEGRILEEVYPHLRGRIAGNQGGGGNSQRTPGCAALMEPRANVFSAPRRAKHWQASRRDYAGPLSPANPRSIPVHTDSPATLNFRPTQIHSYMNMALIKEASRSLCWLAVEVSEKWLRSSTIYILGGNQSPKGV